MWFTSHSRPPLLWPVIRASTVMPSAISDQSPISTAPPDERKLVQPFVGVEAGDDDIEHCTRRRRLGEVLERDHALVHPRQLDKHVVAMNAHDASFDARFGLERLGACLLRSSQASTSSSDRSPSDSASSCFQIRRQACARLGRGIFVPDLLELGAVLGCRSGASGAGLGASWAVARRLASPAGFARDPGLRRRFFGGRPACCPAGVIGECSGSVRSGVRSLRFQLRLRSLGRRFSAGGCGCEDRLRPRRHLGRNHARALRADFDLRFGRISDSEAAVVRDCHVVDAVSAAILRWILLAG